MCMYRDTSEKWGLSYTNPEKWGQSYTFAVKRGLIIYLAALKNGAIWHARPYYAIYGKKRGKRKVQGVPQSQTAALPTP